MTPKHLRRLSPLAAVILTALIFMTAQPVISSVAGEDGPADVGVEGEVDGGGSAPDTLVVGEGGYITITAALNDAAAGDTIAIDPGTYAEEVVVSVKGVTLAGNGDGTVLIDASNLPQSAIVVEAPGVTLRDITAAHGGSEGESAGIRVTANGTGVTITGVNTHSNGLSGIYVDGEGASITRCNSWDNGMSGVTLNAPNCTVDGCEFRGNGFGIIIHSEGNVVTNNSVYHSDSYAIHVGAPGNRVESNDIYTDDGDGSSVFAVDDNTIGQNPVYSAYDPSEDDGDESWSALESPAFMGALLVLALIGIFLMFVRPLMKRRADRAAEDLVRAARERSEREGGKGGGGASGTGGRRRRGKKRKEGPRRKPKGRKRKRNKSA